MCYTLAGSIVFLDATPVFYEKNPNDQYCSIQAEPKVQKVREKFGQKAK
jgi:hypothetical protein